MFDKSAIQELAKAQAITAAATTCAQAVTDAGRGAVALPNDFTITDLEKYMPTRRRLRGSMTTSVVADFSAYATSNSEEGAAIFIDPEKMTATAVLNLGTPDKPGHSDNSAILEPKRTAAYAALRAIANGNPLKQSDAAEFLEDWMGHIECRRDGADIPASKAIAAIRKITIESLKKLESQEQQLSASKSAFESVQATSSEPLPTTIYFECKPYNDLQVRSFVLRLGILTGCDKPSINLRIIKIEEHEEQMAAELAGAIKGSFRDGKLPVMLGKYSAK